MVPQRFIDLIATITSRIGGRTLDAALASDLEILFPPNGAVFHELEALCRAGCTEGWLCARAHDGIRFGRPIKPGAATNRFSVDVVEMDNIVGPHHRHPHGEIDMIMPLTGDARFDGAARGWKVYEPGSAHRPTVAGGKALILYLLPEGAIAFTHG